MIALVVPSNRPDNLRTFLTAWCPVADWDTTIIVHDGPQVVTVGADHEVCWANIDDTPVAAAFSRGDSAIRSFGFAEAYRLGADTILTLDDDCLPGEAAFAAGHIHNLTATPRWCDSAGVRTRGMPYESLGTLPGVAISQGLWQGVPDYDAPTSLVNGTPTTFQPPAGTRVIPAGQFFPMCGMNLAFTREATPLMYFPLMGSGQPFRRFDDIWCGLIAKHICDHLGLRIVCGEPFVHHSRASNTFENLIKEAPGIRENETAWQMIADIGLSGSTPIDCMKEVAESLLLRGGYWGNVGAGINLWIGLFD